MILIIMCLCRFNSPFGELNVKLRIEWLTRLRNVLVEVHSYFFKRVVASLVWVQISIPQNIIFEDAYIPPPIALDLFGISVKLAVLEPSDELTSMTEYLPPKTIKLVVDELAFLEVTAIRVVVSQSVASVIIVDQQELSSNPLKFVSTILIKLPFSNIQVGGLIVLLWFGLVS